MKELSSRVSKLKSSETILSSERARHQPSHMRERSLIDMAQGEITDAKMPEHIKVAIIEATGRDVVLYPPTRGLPRLLEAVSDLFKRDLGLEYGSDQILISNGGKQCLYMAIQALCEVDDEVLIFSPYWVSFPRQVELAGARPVIVPPQKGSLRPDLQTARELINENTKAIVINSPCNPSGVVWTKEELEYVGNLALANDALIISDEVYNRFVFDERKHISVASLSREIQERTLVINSLSKSFAMPGWRIGFAAGPKKLISAMTKLQSHISSGANHVGQHAAIAALTGSHDWIDSLIANVKLRRDIAVKCLEDCPALRCSPVEGTIYIFGEISPEAKVLKGFESRSQAVADELLRRYSVSTVPGHAFGLEGYIRMNFALPHELLNDALDRIIEWGQADFL